MKPSQGSAASLARDAAARKHFTCRAGTAGAEGGMIRRLSVLTIALLAAGCANQRTAPVAPTTAIPAAPPRGEPSQYLNMASAGLQQAFGRPAFVRKDGATEMWRYDGQACRGFFFLYGAPLQVRHVETLPHGVNQAADSACLTALRVSPSPDAAFPP
jgi:hypothetical protein